MRRALLLALVLVLALAGLSGCTPAASAPPAVTSGLGNDWQPTGSMVLSYAQNFHVDHYDGGLALVTTSTGSRFLVVPEGGEVPAGIDPTITVLQRPIHNVYLAATAVMSLFIALDALDSVRFSSVKPEGWYLPEAKAAMVSGRISYGGKYSMPDYELILKSKPDLAIESSMITHAPEVKEKLEAIGIPVLVDQSSYEPHPLGRTEWIKLYGVLLGKESLAEQVFSTQAAYLDEVAGQRDTGKTVAFFHISSAGYVVTRKSGDYVPKMIELAGGEYIFKNLGDSTATSTVNLELEQFYAQAKDADYIIYNSTIGGELADRAELVKLNPLLAD
ncbi:MAG: ABC transporter substrate-binding protein, partial [Propionibacteriaceae bacterium]|nr:ABC transporter substrate-binding protein [Propionibacteriaceae bacterium]